VAQCSGYAFIGMLIALLDNWEWHSFPDVPILSATRESVCSFAVCVVQVHITSFSKSLLAFIFFCFNQYQKWSSGFWRIAGHFCQPCSVVDLDEFKSIGLLHRQNFSRSI
jgi:hypothetical protein